MTLVSRGEDIINSFFPLTMVLLPVTSNLPTHYSVRKLNVTTSTQHGDWRKWSNFTVSREKKRKQIMLIWLMQWIILLIAIFLLIITDFRPSIIQFLAAHLGRSYNPHRMSLPAQTPLPSNFLQVLLGDSQRREQTQRSLRPQWVLDLLGGSPRSWSYCVNF